ncbi:MAG TPA: FtsX-like permease family protein [Puia sp.]|nr:FtsX-like permease family protein [Puia sp.]
MLKNYFKIAWRNISRHKIYTVINVLGLAMGVCACLVIYLITSFEFSFDRFHPGKERIYRIVGELQKGSGEKRFLNSVISDVAGFQHEIPGFDVSSGYHLYGAKVTIPDGDRPAKKFGGRIEGTYSPASIITGPQYFDIFQYQWMVGNAKTALDAPFKVVLSEGKARKYFGDIPLDKMIGRKVVYDDSLQVSVSGIVADWNGNTDFGYTDFISIGTALNSFLKNQIPTDDWKSLHPDGSYAFIKLAKGTDAAQVNARFASFIKEHIKLDVPGAKLSMWLQPLSAIHFTDEFHRGDDGDNFRKAHLPTLCALMGLALFILIIAAVNFINLSTAQSMQRAKEVGVRKVMGSKRSNLIFQFLTETFILTFLAVVLSVLLVSPVLAAFSSYIPEGVTFHLFHLPTVIFLLSVTLITTVLAGFYPARVLSSWLPVLSLKGLAAQKGSEGWNLRKGLIVFQFTISLVFIIGAIIMGNQIRFMRNADKGFRSDAILTVNNWSDGRGKMKLLAEQVRRVAGVDQVILQGNAPMGFAHSGGRLKYKGDHPTDLDVSVEMGNDDFIPFYQMRLVAGRNMVHSDSLGELVVNETCARVLGFTKPGEAVGKFLYSGDSPYPIVGVVADFYENSFHEAVRPVVIEHVPQGERSLAIRLSSTGKSGAEVKTIIARVEALWKSIFPEEPFNYSFLNESIASLFDQEGKTAWLMNIAMSITIFISCMGLFGLAMFTAKRRTKEIGIRKVLGASVTQITIMLSKDFGTLIIIAILIASPVAWYFMNRWLLDFAYRVNISGWVFFIAGTGAFAVALLTVSFQSVKAALMNPVKSLRTE